MTSPVPHQAIYRRWRAQTFSEIVGQEAVVETLRNAVRTGRVAHAVLFVGPRGTGKTSLARILAKALNCTDLRDGDACDVCPSCISIREGTTLDLVEIDAASNRGIDAVRELRERLPYPPGELKRKVYILDEAHQITRDAWNALLKSLEEPPEFVSFMFASTEPSGFPPAILSRLQRYDVRRLTVPEIEGKLTRILASDGRAAEPAALTLIARLAAGGMRDAESMLDQLLSAAPETIDERQVRDLLGLADAEAVDGFVDALVRGDPATGIALLDRLDERGRDTRTLLDQTIEVLRARLISGLSNGDGSVAGLADAARRLAAIDPDRAGIGGLRLQLELALFAAPTARQPAATVQAPAIDGSAASPEPVRTAAVARSVTADGATSASKTTPASVVTERPIPEPAAPPSTQSRPAEPVMARDRGEPVMDRASARDPEPSVAVPDPPAEAVPAAVVTPAAGAAIPTAVPATPTADAAPGEDLTRLLAGWPGIVASVSPAVRAVITECRPMAVDGNIITLGFPEARGFLKDHAERSRPKLEAALAAFLGHDVNVRTMATNLELAPADDLVAEARRIFADDLADVGEVR